MAGICEREIPLIGFYEMTFVSPLNLILGNSHLPDARAMAHQDFSEFAREAVKTHQPWYQSTWNETDNLIRATLS
jgi:hypothetical protein